MEWEHFKIEACDCFIRRNDGGDWKAKVSRETPTAFVSVEARHVMHCDEHARDWCANEAAWMNQITRI